MQSRPLWIVRLPSLQGLLDMISLQTSIDILFLWFKCQFCLESYCSDHFRPAAHHCVKYTSTDRVAPPCPLCQTPICESDITPGAAVRRFIFIDIAIKPNEDPNDAMEAHFTTSCAVMLGNDAAAKSKSKTPRCSKNRCEKVLYTPITCDVSLSRVFPISSPYVILLSI